MAKKLNAKKKSGKGSHLYGLLQKARKRKLSSKDLAVGQFLKMGVVAERPARSVVLPKKVELSVAALDRLTDHCVKKHIRLSYNGLRIV